MRYLLICFALWSIPAFPQTIAVAEFGDNVITLTDENCTQPFLNPENARKLTWREGKEVHQGCFAVNGMGMVITWTDDRVLGAIPVRMFKKAEDI